jgi:Leucine-rich repeat (LRR) protein
MRPLKIITVTLFFFMQTISIAQPISILSNCENQYSDELHICRINFISKECKKFYLVNTLENTEDLVCLNIFKEVEWCYFIDNISKFKNIKNLSISKIKIQNFNFIKELPNLEILYISFNNILNTDSFITNVNNSKIHILTLSKSNNKKQFQTINQLENLKTLGIYFSRLKKINIQIKLDQFYVVDCKLPNYIEIPNVKNLSLVDCNLKKIPKGISSAQNLEALSIKQYKKFKEECAIYGYKSLKYLNLISVPSMIEKDCFLENNNIEILKISY